MTTNSKFIYFSGAQVQTTREENYKVILEDEDETIYVSSKDVEQIQKKTDEREEIIAIILAYIEYIYQETNVIHQRIPHLESGAINDNIIVLLKNMAGEEVIEIIRQLKWYDIIAIFESNNPVQKIRDFW